SYLYFSDMVSNHVAESFYACRFFSLGVPMYACRSKKTASAIISRQSPACRKILFRQAELPAESRELKVELTKNIHKEFNQTVEYSAD
ncbi:MAG: hypothetical protein PUB43_07740, partial [Oscillospiraceae bacterium]|nr:hypothetical protein [Oscillospiraceae bacterium]